MLDPNFSDPEKAHRLHAQKLEAMKMLMNEIVSNPESVKSDDLQKMMNFLDQPTTDTVTDQ